MRALRKYLSYVLVLVLGIGCLGLIACGGSGSSGNSEKTAEEQTAEKTEEAPAPEPEVVVDPSEKFIGEWKMAGLQANGVTMVGDLSAITEDASSSMVIAEDGTGTFAFGEDSTTLTWTLKSDDVITVTLKPTDEDATLPATVDVTYQDECLSLALDSDEVSGILVYSKDGKITNMQEIALGNATDIASADTLVGTWKLSGVRMSGLSVYGDPAALEEMMGDTADPTMVFNEDGTIMAFDSECTWEVTESGATINIDEVSIPVKAFGDNILVDFGSVLGMDMVFMYSHQA